MTPCPGVCPLPELEQTCDRLILVFRHAADMRSRFKRRLFLDLVAVVSDLPRAECRKLFDLWVVENCSNLTNLNT